jgi:hypothetical protein
MLYNAYHMDKGYVRHIDNQCDILLFSMFIFGITELDPVGRLSGTTSSWPDFETLGH